MKCTLLMAILLSGNMAHTSQNTINHIFSANPSNSKPYENSEIWASGNLSGWDEKAITIFHASENFNQKLMELGVQALENRSMANHSPSPDGITTAFSLSSFMWPLLPLSEQDCSQLEAISLVQNTQHQRSSTTFFTRDPISHLFWWGVGD